MNKDEQDCIFCNFSKDPRIKIWEDNLFFAMLDTFPVSPGHTIIVPKRHVIDFSRLTTEEWSDLRLSVEKILQMNSNVDFRKIYSEMILKSKSEISTWFLKKTLDSPNIDKKPTDFNYGVNDGTAAGRTVDHFHWHIIPRFEGDVDDPRGGVRYVIPEMGNYKITRG